MSKIQPVGIHTPSSSGAQINLGGQSRPPLIVTPHPMSVLLFGKKPPKLIDRRKLSKKQKKGLAKLGMFSEQIGELLGAPEGTFEVELCEGDNACISRDGQIAFGLELLEQKEDDHDFLGGVLGHEIGHQPWQWPKGDLSGMTKKQLDEMYCEEEAKADRFSGRVMADLGLKPDAICAFFEQLSKFELHPPSDYYPAKVRAEMVKEAFEKRKKSLVDAARWNPRILEKQRELR